MENAKKLVGKRILFTFDDEAHLFDEEIREGIIKDVSPDGQYVRLYIFLPKKERGEEWYEARKVIILSILGDKEKTQNMKEEYL